ncbi:zinc finger C2H2-type/integrase DNA-binding domain-containing protein [Fagus crenata]
MRLVVEMVVGQVQGGRAYHVLRLRPQFPSERALSGHMRMHPDREWRGLLPPLFLYVSQSPQQNGSTSVAIDLNEFLGHGDEENGPPRVVNEFPEPEDDDENTVRLVVEMVVGRRHRAQGEGGHAYHILKLRPLPPYRCVVCQKEFPSERALSGHMRVHQDREWKGLLPPLFLYVSQSPTGNWYAHSPRGQGTNMMEPQQNGSNSVAIDLNEFLGHGDEENGPPRVHGDEENGPPRVAFDLNEFPFDLNEFPEPKDD